MSKYCPTCGFANKDDDLFCGSCGTKMADQQARPTQRRSAPQSQSPVTMVARTIMKFIPFILIGMIIFSVVLFSMNITADYEVTATGTVEYEGEKEEMSESGKLSELYEADEFAPLAISGLAFAAYNMILAIMALFMVIKVFRGNRKIRRSLNRYSLMGFIGSVVYLILFWITGTVEQTSYGITVTISVAPHATVWVSIVLYALLYAVNFLSKPKKVRRT